MASQKKSTNALLAPAVSGFSLSQSFGTQAAVLVPTASPASTPSTPLMQSAPFTSSPADPSALSAPGAHKSPALSPMGPPQLRPPPAGVFLLPPRGSTPGPLGPPASPALAGNFLGPAPPSSSIGNVSSGPLGPPPSNFSAGSFSTVSQGPVKRSPYVPPPGEQSGSIFYFGVTGFGLDCLFL